MAISLFDNTRFQGLLLFVLAFLLYSNTLGHDFVLDDQVVLTQNRWVQEGLSGIPELFRHDAFAGYLPEDAPAELLTGGRYRPLSLALFAVITQLFGTASWIFHLLAMLVYAFSGLSFFYTIRLALKPALALSPGLNLVAFASALLFVVHPVHTEVVANCKSLDEQLAFLGGLGVLYASLKFVDTKRLLWGVASGIFFFAACLSKENAITIVLIAPMTLWFFRSWKAIRPAFWGTTAVLFLVLAGYVVLRGALLDWHFTGTGMSDPLNNPFLQSDGEKWTPFEAAGKAATILYTLFQYLRLLVWPYPLTHDYYPFHITQQTFGQPGVLAAIVLYAFLLGFSIWGLIRKNRIAFGVLFYLIAIIPVSNIFIPTGTFMAERFLYLPSAGFCWATGAGLFWASSRIKRPAIFAGFVLIPVVLIFSVLALKRNMAWSDNKRLFETDIATSPNSAKLRNSLGTLYLTEALQATDPSQRRSLLLQAEENLERALELHPSYYDALLAYGACVFYLQKFDHSIGAYRVAQIMNPDDTKPVIGLAYALRFGGESYLGDSFRTEEGVSALMESWQLLQDTAVATRLATHFVYTGKPAEAVAWWEKALTLAPNDARLQDSLRRAYLAAGQPQKATEISRQEPSSFIITSDNKQQQ